MYAYLKYAPFNILVHCERSKATKYQSEALVNFVTERTNYKNCCIILQIVQQRAWGRGSLTNVQNVSK